jgi:hypothetical protein
MRVKMLVNTFHEVFRNKGKSYDVDEVTAQRWIANGIASGLVSEASTMENLWAMGRWLGIKDYRKKKKAELVGEINAQLDVAE